MTGEVEALVISPKGTMRIRRMTRPIVAAFCLGSLLVPACKRPAASPVAATPALRPTDQQARALRDEILAMAEEDQRLRMALMVHDPPDMKALHALEAADQKNTARMKQIVANHGWPSRSLVGPEASQKAWLLVQHASDLDFQRHCLERMEPLVEQGEVRRSDYAYLFDRIQVLDSRPQRYGTQFRTKDGVTAPFPIEDPDQLDQRREAMGLGSFEEYKKKMTGG